MNGAMRGCMAAMAVGVCAGAAAADPPYDCFGNTCPFEPPILHYSGRPDGIPDDQQCVGDWDRDGWVLPADVASYVVTWFFSANNPGVCDGDLDCDGAVTPADLALFIQYWLAAVHGGGGCP